jgi:hypothetical protein
VISLFLPGVLSNRGTIYFLTDHLKQIKDIGMDTKNPSIEQIILIVAGLTFIIPPTTPTGNPNKKPPAKPPRVAKRKYITHDLK